MQALVAVDRRARAGLALQVDDRRPVREHLHDQIALRLAALDVVGADMAEDAGDGGHAPVDGDDRAPWRRPPPAAPAPSRPTSFGLSTMPFTPLASAASMSAVCLGEDILAVALDRARGPAWSASALKAFIMWTKKGKFMPGNGEQDERLVVGEGGRGERHGEQARGYNTAGEAHG